MNENNTNEDSLKLKLEDGDIYQHTNKSKEVCETLCNLPSKIRSLKQESPKTNAQVSPLKISQNETEGFIMPGSSSVINGKMAMESLEHCLRNSKSEEFILETKEFGVEQCPKENFSEDNTREMPFRLQSISIPNTEQIMSSPEIAFGQDTLNMVDEFMRDEADIKTESKKASLLSRIVRRLFCCRMR